MALQKDVWIALAKIILNDSRILKCEAEFLG
jgi:hypothetical protein